MAEFGRGLWRPPGPTPCSSRATHLQQNPRTMPRWLLNISEDGNSRISQGNLISTEPSLLGVKQSQFSHRRDAQSLHHLGTISSISLSLLLRSLSGSGISHILCILQLEFHTCRKYPLSFLETSLDNTDYEIKPYWIMNFAKLPGQLLNCYF